MSRLAVRSRARSRTDTVRALRLGTFDPRVALAALGGGIRGDLRRGGTGSPLRLAEMSRPKRPAGWVSIRPSLAGICASDRKFLSMTGWGRTLLYIGFPRAIVPGHEIVGTVVEADDDAELNVGDRVVAEPILGCVDRGAPLCRSCSAGNDNICERVASSSQWLGGQGFGHNARYGGGWAEELVAPSRLVHRVPDDLDDRDAVLAEPAAVAAHAVLRNLPDPGSRVLVIGPGTIGLLTVYALSTLAPDVDVTVAGLGSFADEHAREAGAGALIHGARAVLVDQAGALLGSRIHGGRLSGPVLESGFDTVFDAVGSVQTLDDAFRMTRPGGTVVLLGTAITQEMDWTLVWWRELTVRGSVYYAQDEVPERSRIAPGPRRTLEVALDLLAERRPGHLVTHVFPLDEPVDALKTAESGPGAGAVKVAFAP